MSHCTPWICALLVASCFEQAPLATDDPTTWLFHHDATGVAFELPAAWQVTETGPALVFSGPPGSADYFTTVTLQATNQEMDLQEALDVMLAELATLPRYALHLREPVVIGTRPALRYGLQVEVHESLRWKHGILFPASGATVHVAYSATPELFPVGVPVFEGVLSTLAVVDTTP